MKTPHPLQENRKHQVKILLAEDNPVNQRLVLNIFENSGYKVDAVSNGLQAFNAAKAGEYNIIFMDVQMPQMNGVEATDIIRQNEIKQNQQKAVIIAMTAHSVEGYKDHCLKAGMDDYITKPIDPGALLKLVEKWIQQADAPDHQDISGATGTKDKEEQPHVFDLSAALKRTRNNNAFLQSILNDFCKDLDIKIQRLKEAVSHNEREEITRLAHALKGTSASVGADVISRLSASIESADRKNDEALMDGFIKELENQILQFHAHIHAIDWHRI